MAAKRPAAGSDGGPAAKKPLLMQSPLFMPPATSQEDLDIKVLQVQNRKLSDRLRERTRSQNQLQHRLDKEEERTSQYGEVLSVVEAHLTDLKDLLEGSAAGNDEPLPLVKSLVGSSRDHALHQLEVYFTSLSSSISRHDNQSLAQLKESLEQGVSDDSPLLSKLEDLLSRHEVSLAAYERVRKEAGSFSVQQLKGREEFLKSEQKRLETKLADTIFDHEKALSRIDLLEAQLLSQHHQQQSLPSSEGPPPAAPPLTAREGEPASSLSSTSSSSTSETPPTLMEAKGKSMISEEFESLQSEKEELTKTAESRLLEINQLTQHITELKQEIERNKLASLQVSDGTVKESSVYKALQTQYSVLIMEQSQMKACYDEVRRLLLTAKTQHIVQLEEIRQEELKYQAEVREEMAQMELSLAREKRAYEMLRVEHERILASNELAAPVVKEMQQTLSSVQQSNQQLKAEVTRYKTRAHKAEEKLTKLQEDKESAAGEGVLPLATTTPTPAPDNNKPSKEVHDLHERVKVLEGEKKSLEAKLEGFSSLSQEEREKAEVLAGEKKALSQVEDMKKKFEEARKDYEKKREHLREDIKQLNRDLSSKREEVQALMREMELTAQAFEDMQEQNIRLLQQLREKDDANFKLMSERIKASTMQKLLVEEKSLLQAEAATMNAERERLNLLVQRLEERDKHSEQTLAASEKELNLKQQALDLHKKRAMDSVQTAHEVQLRVLELETQLTSTRQSLMSKTDECEREALSTRRCQEEITGLRRKLEKYKTREWASAGDEVLLEEIKTYKAKLNCPCCSSRKKDTVLTKCFHVFCAECIRTRYETRQRKCPKCNAAFGANDFHKIYLS